MDNYIQFLIPSVIGLITTICAAFFSAHWAVRRAFKERWWERKEQAYTDIIEALHNLLRYSALCANDYQDRSEHPKKKEFGERYTEAYWNIQKMTDIGPFVISNQAADILQKLRNKPQLEWNENPPWDIYEADCENYREALEGIRECAKIDLKVS